MEKTSNYDNPPFDEKIGKLLFLASYGLAIIGTLFLLIIILITVISILGRLVFSSSLLGDYELVEVGCAVAIFSFLPICQLKNGNVKIDFFSSLFPSWVNHFLDALSSVLLMLFAVFFAWRMLLGAVDMYFYNYQTMLLKLPIWVGFLPAVLSFILFALCSLYRAYTHFLSIKAGT